MTVSLFQVDAFTDTPFGGNPAAVCLLPHPRDDRWMQLVAREMNLSETAFLHKQADGFSLRWFTPTVEVDLCGHATLASAHILWETGMLALNEQAQFHTRSGLLMAERNVPWIELNFPATPAEPVSAPPELLQALGGVECLYSGKSVFDYLVQVSSEEELRAIQPDMALLKTLPVRGVIVTSRAATPAYDFVSRFFAPAAGIDEDPVTGSSHCCLAPFWCKQLCKDACVAYQASARGGVVRVQLDHGRVLLGGQAVTVLRGEVV